MKKLVLPLLMGVLCVHGDTVTLHPTADTSLFENDPSNNFGSSKDLPAGLTKRGLRGRTLMKFDLRGIPANAVISNVTLSVKVVSAPLSPANSTFELHRMLVAWVEGNHPPGSDQHGVPAATGESTWSARLAPSTHWASPGGGAGVDFSTNVSSAVLIKSPASYVFPSTTNLVIDVQSWLQDTNSNHGWMVLSASERVPSTARRFGSRENTGNIPALTVSYSLPAVTVQPLLSNIGRTGNLFIFEFLAQANQAYVVELRDGLGTSLWQTFTNLNATAFSNTVTVADDLSTNLQRFFRVRLR